MNPLGRRKFPLETLSTSTAQANISNCCESRSEQSFLFPSVKLKRQDKVAAYTCVVTSVGYIYLITTGELGSSLKHRDEPKLMIAGKPALFQICHVDVMPCTVDCGINERIGVSSPLQIQSLKTTTRPQCKVSLQQEAIILHTSGTRRGCWQEKVQKCVYQSGDECLSSAG